MEMEMDPNLYICLESATATATFPMTIINRNLTIILIQMPGPLTFFSCGQVKPNRSTQCDREKTEHTAQHHIRGSDVLTSDVLTSGSVGYTSTSSSQLSSI